MRTKIYFYTYYQKDPKESERLALLSVHDFFKDDSVRIEKDKYGKPFLPDKEAYISVSHSGKLLVVCVSRVEVGIDCEQKRQVTRYRGLSRKYFREEDRVKVVNEKSVPFLKMWTRYEALSKLDGRGICALSKLDFSKVRFFDLEELLPFETAEKYYITAVSKRSLKPLKEKVMI